MNVADAVSYPVSRSLVPASCESAIIENYVTELGVAQPIQFNKCGVTQFFNNQTSAGKLIPGYNQVTHRP